MLADVSIEYYPKIERGSLTGVSDGVVATRSPRRRTSPATGSEPNRLRQRCPRANKRGILASDGMGEEVSQQFRSCPFFVEESGKLQQTGLNPLIGDGSESDAHVVV